MGRLLLAGSLRKRLALICAVSFLLAAVGVWAEEAVDYQETQGHRLQDIAEALMAVAESDSGLKERSSALSYIQSDAAPAKTPRDLWKVWTRDGVLLLRSHAALDGRPIVPLERQGLSDVMIGGRTYRVVTLHSEDDSLVVQAAEADEGVWGGSAVVRYWRLALPLAFAPMLVALLLMLWQTIRSINRMADKLRLVDPLEPARVNGGESAPAIGPMASALNELFDRVAHAASVERSLSAAVAHEIRGSLAGIRAQAQLASGAAAADELGDALASLMSGVDRAARMLDQVFDLARVNGLRRDGHPEFEPVDIARVYDEVKQETGARAAAKQITLATDFAAHLLPAIRPAMFMLLRNLIENAILYSPPGGRVEVTTRLRLREFVLVVEDSGPGIPAAERQLAFERFNRLNQSQTVGVGLGLWIVKRIVEMHGARVRLLDSILGGLKVEVAFAAVASSRAPGSSPGTLRKAA